MIHRTKIGPALVSWWARCTAFAEEKQSDICGGNTAWLPIYKET